MLTGRLPSSTRYFGPPDVLRRDVARAHLPGILRRAGYVNYEVTVRGWADAHDLNMHNGFDWANHRRVRAGRGRTTLLYLIGFDATHLLERSAERVGQRLLHIVGRRDKRSPYREVTAPGGETRDVERVPTVTRIIENSREPYFIHVHLMGTHGP